ARAGTSRRPRRPPATAEAAATRGVSAGAGASFRGGGGVSGLVSLRMPSAESREDDRCHPPSLSFSVPALVQELLELGLETGQDARCRAPVEDPVDRLVDVLRALVVLGSEDARRACDAWDVRRRRIEVRRGLPDGRIVRERR